MMFRTFYLAGFTVAAVAVLPALSWADVVARVVSIHDGDRLTIRYDGRSETIHLKDVDCPELTQPFGKQAKHATAAYVGNRDVVVRGLSRDKQGRISAEVLLNDGRSLGRELLKEGLAWWKRSPSGDARLEVLEELAKAGAKGLWSEPNPVPPWEWKEKSKVKRGLPPQR